jgi:hypothetical protein
MPQQDETSPQAEHRYHFYADHVIPWYVRLIWLGFWIFVIYYTVKYMFPAMQVELLEPTK